MRVLVATLARQPVSPRVLQQWVCPLLDAGHEVVYAAPFSATGSTPPPGVAPVDLPGDAVSRCRETRRLLGRHVGEVDLLVVHDPTLLLALPSRRPATVWEVPDEYTARTGRLGGGVGRWAERRMHVLLAAERDRTRFRRPHPVASGSPRAYVDQLERWVRAA